MVVKSFILLRYLIRLQSSLMNITQDSARLKDLYKRAKETEAANSFEDLGLSAEKTLKQIDSYIREEYMD